VGKLESGSLYSNLQQYSGNKFLCKQNGPNVNYDVSIIIFIFHHLSNEWEVIQRLAPLFVLSCHVNKKHKKIAGTIKKKVDTDTGGHGQSVRSLVYIRSI
jgi:hypothetical protein